MEREIGGVRGIWRISPGTNFVFVSFTPVQEIGTPSTCPGVSCLNLGQFFQTKWNAFLQHYGRDPFNLYVLGKLGYNKLWVFDDYRGVRKYRNSKNLRPPPKKSQKISKNHKKIKKSQKISRNLFKFNIREIVKIKKSSKKSESLKILGKK